MGRVRARRAVGNTGIMRISYLQLPLLRCARVSFCERIPWTRLLHQVGRTDSACRHASHYWSSVPGASPHASFGSLAEIRAKIAARWYVKAYCPTETWL